MPAARLWRRIVRHHERARKEQEEEYRKWIIEQLCFARSVTFALQANSDPPPEKPSKSGTNWGKVEQVRKQMMAFMERHQKGISHPYYFEEYMGLANDERGHAFPPPPEVADNPATRTKDDIARLKKEAREREKRMIASLKNMIDTYGNLEFG